MRVNYYGDQRVENLYYCQGAKKMNSPENCVQKIVNTEIKAVTIYTNQALVTRKTELELTGGRKGINY